MTDKFVLCLDCLANETAESLAQPLMHHTQHIHTQPEVETNRLQPPLKHQAGTNLKENSVGMGDFSKARRGMEAKWDFKGVEGGFLSCNRTCLFTLLIPVVGPTVNDLSVHVKNHMLILRWHHAGYWIVLAIRYSQPGLALEQPECIPECTQKYLLHYCNITGCGQGSHTDWNKVWPDASPLDLSLFSL